MGEIGELAKALAFLAAGLGSGIVTIGAGLGIGKIAAAAMDGTARQPEATNAIRMTMIIAAAAWLPLLLAARTDLASAKNSTV